MRVLIIEDDPQVAGTLADGLRTSGYEVCGIAADAAEAIVMTRLRRPAIAIVDLHLGENDDGIETARQLMRLSDAGILFLTGYPEDLQRRADVGHAWMQKPCLPGELAQGIELVAAMKRGWPLPKAMPPTFHPIVP